MLIIFPMLICGSLMGGAIYAALYPMEIIKTKLQMRNELVKGGAARWHLRLAHRKLFANELIEIWREMARHNHFRTNRVGMIPMYFLGLITTAMRLSTYQYAYQNEFLSTAKQDVLQPRAILFCGVVGSVSQVVMNPFNLMKTKLQYWALCQSSLTRKLISEITFMEVGRILYQKLGWRIFQIGFGCCVYRGFIANIVQMITYQKIMNEVDDLDAIYFKLTDTEYDIARFNTALVTGLISTMFVSPFDVILTRLHTQPYSLNLRGLYYANFQNAMYKVIKFEGYHGLWKGAIFLWARHGVGAAASMLFWDQWKDRALESIKYNKEEYTIAFIEQYFVEYCFDHANLF